MANEWLKSLAYFLEKNWFKLEFKEAYLKNDRSEAIMLILWRFMQLPFTYIDQEFCYWAKRIYHQLYHINIPYCINDRQKLKLEIVHYDEAWNKGEESQNQNLQIDREKHLNKLLQSKNAQIVIKTSKSDYQGRNEGDSKIRIFDEGMQMQINTKQDMQDQKIKIDFGGQ